MQPSIPPGTLLQNRYRLVKVLGQGGFGRTYLAEDQARFNERCVVKEYIQMQGDTYALEKSKELFQRESAILYQIQHPQIPQFRANFEQGRRLFFVQDYADGKTYSTLLEDRLEQNQTFSEQDYANPFFMLDELDKMPRSQHFDSDGALLTLLEPSTAKTFHDMSVPALSLDVSYATWIGTCNERRAISEPVLSRFRIFKIPSIGKDHVEAFTRRMLDEVAQELGVRDVKYTLRPEAVQLLTKLPPRAMRRVMRECIAYACMLRKSTISDKLVEQAVEDPSVFRDGPRRVGF